MRFQPGFESGFTGFLGLNRTALYPELSLYTCNPEKNAAQLNMAFASTAYLYNMLNAIRTWFRNANPMLELGKELPKMPADL